MTSYTARTLFTAGFAAVLAGCSSSRGTTQAAPSPQPQAGDVTSDDISRAPGQSIEEHLRGRVAGVTVTRTAEGGIAVRIRGATSIYGSSEPLYVLDGVPITPGPGGSLTGIDPYDIESIKVLKDPADTAMYGMRGANGVIVITTKRAMRKQKPS
jgi:TonB-dependent SusC/RagA subfamily outer membrane receptor